MFSQHGLALRLEMGPWTHLTFAFGHDGDGGNDWSVGEHLGMIWQSISDHFVAIKHNDQLTSYEKAVNIPIHVS